MSNIEKLQGITFDQQLQLVDGGITPIDILPNVLVSGEIVFEPLATGIRVTARDAQHRILWGYVGSEEKLKQTHCLVAIYDTLQSLLAEQLEANGLHKREITDPVAVAQSAIDKLDKTINWLRDSLDVKKVTDATADRAKVIAQIASDANQQIILSASSLKGMKSMTS